MQRVTEHTPERTGMAAGADSAHRYFFNFRAQFAVYSLPKWYALMRFNTPEQIIAGLQDADTRRPSLPRPRA